MFSRYLHNLHFQQQCVKVPISPHLDQQLLLPVFLMIDILVGVKWFLIVFFGKSFIDKIIHISYISHLKKVYS